MDTAEKIHNRVNFSIIKPPSKVDIPFPTHPITQATQHGLNSSIMGHRAHKQRQKPLLQRTIPTPFIMPKPKTITQPNIKSNILREPIPTLHNTPPQTAPMGNPNPPGTPPPPLSIPYLASKTCLQRCFSSNPKRHNHFPCKA
jgi:hypothetical protein